MSHRISYLITAVMLSICLSDLSFAGPKISIPDATFSFGKILQHAVLTKRFWIKSTGDAPVKIAEIKPDCGCTELFTPDSVIKVGDSMPIDVVLHTRSFLGFIEKRPLIRIADSNDTTRLKLYAEILIDPGKSAPLVIGPEKVDVSQYNVKPRRKATFTITNKGASDYQLTVVDSVAKSFEVVLPKVIKAGQTVEGQVIVRKSAVPTSFEESFTFELNDDGRTRYSVPIWRQYQVKETPAAPSGK